MKTLIVALVLAACSAQAQWEIHLKASLTSNQVESAKEAVQKYPGLYAEASVVTTNALGVRTNTVRTLVQETDRQKTKRLLLEMLNRDVNHLLSRAQKDVVVE